MPLQPAGARAGYAWPALEAMAALAAGEPARAAALFSQSIGRLGQAARRNDPLLPGLYEPFHVLALLATRQADRARERIERLGRRDREDPIHPAAATLRRLAQAMAGAPLAPRQAPILERITPGTTTLNLFLEVLGAYLGGEPLAPEPVDRLLRACAPLPLAWFAGELRELGDRLRGQPARPSPLLDLVPQQAPWERALASLVRLGAKPPEPQD
jgi:hypothetical protein